jgi:hypothetical protein
MMRSILKLALLSSALFAAGIPITHAADAAKEPPHAIVSLYHVAPGKHLDFLKWMAAREAVAKNLGLPATQVYAHTDGDSWDYMAVSPMTTPDQDMKMDEASKKAGLTTGYKAALELRQYMASHTDTYTVGPVSAADLVAEGSK